MTHIPNSTGAGTHTFPHVRRALMVLCSVAVVWAQPASAQQLLENPQPLSSQSGISAISGWVCKAGKVQILIDGEGSAPFRLDAAYGTERGDTLTTCGDINNGFSVLVNWNALAEGQHTVALCVDDICAASVPITVQSYGESFLRGRSAILPVCTNKLSPPFPTPTVLTWQESSQSWAIGLTPTCQQVATDCSPLPATEPARSICTALLNCCQ